MCNYEARIVGLLLAVKIVLQLTKTHCFDNGTLICRTVQMSASLPPAATAAGESEQQHAPPAPVPTLSRCANSPLGCSVLDYEALPDDVSGLLYDCARQGKVNNIRFILDVSGPGGVSTLCAPMATQGLCGCSSPVAPRMSHQMGPGTQA